MSGDQHNFSTKKYRSLSISDEKFYPTRDRIRVTTSGFNTHSLAIRFPYRQYLHSVVLPFEAGTNFTYKCLQSRGAVAPTLLQALRADGNTAGRTHHSEQEAGFAGVGDQVEAAKAVNDWTPLVIRAPARGTMKRSFRV